MVDSPVAVSPMVPVPAEDVATSLSAVVPTSPVGAAGELNVVVLTVVLAAVELTPGVLVAAELVTDEEVKAVELAAALLLPVLLAVVVPTAVVSPALVCEPVSDGSTVVEPQPARTITAATAEPSLGFDRTRCLLLRLIIERLYSD